MANFKRVCYNDKVIVAGVDVRNFVSRVETVHEARFIAWLVTPVEVAQGMLLAAGASSVAALVVVLTTR